MYYTSGLVVCNQFTLQRIFITVVGIITLMGNFFYICGNYYIKKIYYT